MPNPKTGTVTPECETAVNNAKAGQMRFRTDKNGIVHGGIGKVNFEPDAIKGNLVAVLADLKKAKPAAAKGVYVRKSDAVDDDGPGRHIDHKRSILNSFGRSSAGRLRLFCGVGRRRSRLCATLEVFGGTCGNPG